MREEESLPRPTEGPLGPTDTIDSEERRKDSKIRISFEGAETRERNKQYFRFNDEEMEERAWLLMEKRDLTPQDILDFCNGKMVDDRNRDNAIQLAYRSRRLEIHELLKKLKTGEAIVDADGRLRPIDDGTQAALNNLPVLPPIPQPVADNNRGLDNPPVPNEPQPPAGGDHHQQQQLLLQRQAEAAVSRAVERYRQQGVPMETIELIELPIPEPTIPAPLTFRRILIAVTAVVLAFLFMLMQTIGRPSPHYHHRVSSSSSSGSMSPQYTDNLLQSRDFLEHIAECGLEDRNWTRNHGFWGRLWTGVNKEGAHEKSCGRGVLMVPSPNTIIRRMVKAISRRDVDLWTPYIIPEAGVNVTWWMPCKSTLTNVATNQCSSTMCFRGIHDALVPNAEVQQSISLGASLIENGGDHFDVYGNIDILRSSVPTLVDRLATLLQTEYKIPNPQAVAFRVHAAAPLSGDGVQSSHLKQLLNRTNYRQWMEMAAYQNRLAAHFPIPWPLTLFAPVRDTCNLLADQQANPAFEIHTTVLLSEEQSSGLLLYVDEMQKVVTRGLAIESAPGRIVVSTGGAENERCRLPPHSGVSASLQIWWQASGDIGG